MTPEPSPETPVPRIGVSVFYAHRLHRGLYIVDDGGEVSLVDRETLLLLLQQLFIEGDKHD